MNSVCTSKSLDCLLSFILFQHFIPTVTISARLFIPFACHQPLHITYQSTDSGKTTIYMIEYFEQTPSYMRKIYGTLGELVKKLLLYNNMKSIK